MHRAFGAGIALALAMGVWGCGGGGSAGDTAGNGSGEAAAAASAGAELTAEQLAKGIGPIDRVELGPLDAALADRGAEIFQLKCSACHQLDERYVGPPLRDVTERRTPEFVMNMMLNPTEMVQKHPVTKELLAQYYTPMPSQDLTVDDARALLEYLRRAREEQAPSASADE